MSANHPINVRLVEAFERIKQDTRGALVIKSFPNSILGGDPAMVIQLRSGALEMLAESGGILDSVVPVAGIEELAYAFPNKRTVFEALDGQLGQYIRAQLQTAGLVAMDRIFENGYRQFTTSNHPIRTAEDLQGLKLRVSPGRLRVDTFRSLGAAPTPISASEVYTALGTHVVDGQETALAVIEDLRYYEVQKYCSLSNHIWNGFFVVINADKWASLSSNMQAVVRKHLGTAAILQRGDNARLEVSLRDKLGRQGLLFNDVDIASLRAKLVANGYYARWRTEYGPTAWNILEKYTGPLG